MLIKQFLKQILELLKKKYDKPKVEKWFELQFDELQMESGKSFHVFGINDKVSKRKDK